MKKDKEKEKETSTEANYLLGGGRLGNFFMALPGVPPVVFDVGAAPILNKVDPLDPADCPNVNAGPLEFATAGEVGKPVD